MSTGNIYNGYWRAKLLDRKGQLKTQPIHGFTENQYWDVTRKLQRQGYEVVALSWKSKMFGGISVLGMGRINTKRLLVLNALLQLIEVGYLPGQALFRLADAMNDPELQTRLKPAKDVLEQRGDLSEALKVTGLFSSDVLQMLSNGDRTGDMKGAIQQSIEFLNNRFKAVKRLSWMMGILLMELVTVNGMGIAAEMGGRDFLTSTLNGYDEAIIEKAVAGAAPYFALNFWMLVLSGLFFAVITAFGVAYSTGSDKTRRKLDPMVRHIPGLGALIHDQTFSVTLGITSRVLLSGGQLMEALRAGHDSSGVPLVRDYYAGALHRLRMGALPELAMQSETLNRFERVSLSSFGDAKQLGKLLGSLAESRASTMFTGLVKFLAIMSVFTFIHGSVVAAVMMKGPSALGEAFQSMSSEYDKGEPQ